MRSILTVAIILFSITSIAQDCKVNLESIKGIYAGECRNGKAEGKGKASGTDTYEGNFRNGLPDGYGTYIEKNGSVFKGNFKKGMREGQGEYRYKLQNDNDSIITG